jgi:hypothetical protein
MLLLRRFSLVPVLASAVILGCVDTAPTGPALVPVNAEPAAARKGASLTSAVDQVVGATDLDGTLRITRLGLSDEGQLLVSGVLSGTANGIPFTQAFSDVPATLSGAAAPTSGSDEITTMQAGSGCDILLLDLGPLHLDLLGLEVDLAEVILDVTATAGAGNLVGNLLCAVVHLLDGPAIFSSIINLLDRINTLLSLV